MIQWTMNGIRLIKKRPVQTPIQRGFLSQGTLQSCIGSRESLCQPQVKGTGSVAAARGCDAGAVLLGRMRG